MRFLRKIGNEVSFKLDPNCVGYLRGANRIVLIGAEVRPDKKGNKKCINKPCHE